MINVWDNPLYLGARYPVPEIASGPPFSINYSEISNKTYLDQQAINQNNGLMGIPTNATKAALPQSLCDQSTIELLKILHNDSQFETLNSILPDRFETSPSIRALDCGRSKEYGLRLLRSIDDYQKNCWAYCFEPSMAGYRKRLGSPYDEALDNSDDASVSPYQRNISNALVRLLVCDSAGWFASSVSTVVYEVFSMCSSSAACASLCSGIANQTDASQYQQYYRSIIDYVKNVTAPVRETVLIPSLVADLVQPIGQVAGLFALSISENSAGSAVPQFIDSLANPKSGQCRAYDGTMSDLREATGSDLSPFRQFAASDSLPSMKAVRSPAFAACQEAINQLYAVCSRKDTMDLCARAYDPDVDNLGSFSTCDDSGLLVYRGAALDFNDKCGPLFGAKLLRKHDKTSESFTEWKTSRI